MRPLLLLVLFVALADPLLAQEATRPWETWQPPAVKLPQPNGFDTYQAAFDLKREIDAQWMPAQPAGAPGAPGPVAAPAAPPAPPPPPGAPPPPPAPPGAPPLPPGAPRPAGTDQWGVGPADLPLPDRVVLYAEVLKLVREALAQETRLPAVTGSAQLLPYLSGFRAFVRLLAMEAEVHRLAGDNLAAAASALDALEVAQDVATQRILVSWLTGIACEAIALKSLDATIPLLKADECKAALGRLLKLDESKASVKQPFDGEEVFARLCFKEIMANPAMMGNVLGEEQTPAQIKELLATMQRSGWQAIGQTYEDFRAAADLPYIRQPRPFPKPEDPFMAFTTPAFDKVLFRDAHARALFRLREGQLATRAYLLEKGQLPQDLTALVPSYLPAIPADPFGEGPLRSVVADGKLTLYSLGPDGADDMGKAIADTPPQVMSTGDLKVVVAP